jgi:protein TonB
MPRVRGQIMAMSILFSPGERKLGKGLGVTVTVAVHLLILLVLLPSHVQAPPQSKSLLNARIISDAPMDKPEEVPTETQLKLDTPKVTMPLPEIVIAKTPSSEPSREIHAAMSANAKPTPENAVDSLPRFDADYLNNPPPVYPRVSRRLREAGIVTLRVFVSPGGAPTIVELEQTSGFARLDESAMEAVRLWKFSPAKSAGMAVGAWVVVPVEFSLNT